ncbi:MAG: SDR family NAD(P)-dependent oxidoreductase, partial [Marmoricola sp.]
MSTSSRQPARQPAPQLARSLARALDTVMDRTVAPGYTKVGSAVRSRLPGWPDDPAPRALAGRTAAVTGATSGLGLATAEGFARLGADLRLVVRDVEKGAGLKSRLEAEFPGVQVAVDRCDVSDLDDVRRFAGELDLDHLDVLVHNAGSMPATRTESAQGHELSMALHVLGPLLMTELLRPRLAGSADGSGVLSGGRVILVTSGGMYGQRLRADDPEFLSGEYSGTTAYARSKRAQVELLPALADR